MALNCLGCFIIALVCIDIINESQGEKHPVKIDSETGELYYEHKTTTGIEKVVIHQANIEAKKKEEKSVKTSGGIQVSKDGIGIQFTREKHWERTVTYSRKGGKVELPVTESCLMDSGCRESILGTVNNAITEDGRKSIEQLN